MPLSAPNRPLSACPYRAKPLFWLGFGSGSLRGRSVYAPGRSRDAPWMLLGCSEDAPRMPRGRSSYPPQNPKTLISHNMLKEGVEWSGVEWRDDNAVADTNPYPASQSLITCPPVATAPCRKHPPHAPARQPACYEPPIFCGSLCSSVAARMLPDDLKW